MMLQEGKTIYEELKEFYDKNPQGVYPYQNLDFCGLKEFRFENNSEVQTLAKWQKRNVSTRLINILADIISNKKSLEELKEFLVNNPIIEYYDVYIEFLNNYLKVQKALKMKMCKFLKTIIVKADNDEIINFSIITSVCIKDDELNEIIKVFSVHNSYIFYYILTLKYRDMNDEIFNLAQGSKGYGRILCIMNLNIVDKNMRKWLIEEGLNNNNSISEILKYTILSDDFIYYIKENAYEEKAFEKIAFYISSYLLEEYEIYEIDNGNYICEYLVKNIEENPEGIYSLYCISGIMSCIEDGLFYKCTIKKECYDEEVIQFYRNILDRCRKICRNKKWNDVLLNEVSNVDIESSVILDCAERIKYKIKKNEFKGLFERNCKSPSLYKYAFSCNNKVLENFILKEGLKSFNMTEILSGQDDIHLNNIKYSQIEHICFFILISNVAYEGHEEIYKKINIEALSSPVIETRKSALNNLLEIKDLLDDYEKDEIIEIKNREINSEIREKIKLIIGNFEYKNNNYINVVNYTKIKPHVKDILLNTVNVEGTEYIDLTQAEDLEVNSIVYVLKSSENSDFLTITTTKGYVIGYLSQNSNLELYNLCDNNKYIYGVVKNYEKEEDVIILEVYLSYQDVIEEIENTLSLLTGPRINNYLQ